MNASSAKEIRVLSIDPTTGGFGFAVMEGENNIIDWGVKVAAGADKNASCLRLIARLLDRYEPEVVIVETLTPEKSRRCERVRELIRNILNLAVEWRIRTRMYSRLQVREAFKDEDASTKHQISLAIAKHLPELSPRVPPYRRPWMSEDYRMAIFDAVALALTFFHFKAQREVNTLSALGINSSNHDQEKTMHSCH